MLIIDVTDTYVNDNFYVIYESLDANMKSFNYMIIEIQFNVLRRNSEVHI